MLTSKESVFQPKQPVNPDRFKGRQQTIEEIIRYFPGVLSGQPRHFFITGKRGMGKTSLANFISDYAEKNYSMITAHIMNDGVHTVDELVTQIIERILNSIKSESWHEKIFNVLRDHIEYVGFGNRNTSIVITIANIASPNVSSRCFFIFKPSHMVFCLWLFHVICYC